MSFETTPGRMLIRDGSDIVFDTNQELLHLIGSREDGSISRGSLDWGGASGPTSRFYDAAVETGLPSAATHILGLVRFTFSTGFSYLPSGSWFVAGGSFLLEHKAFQNFEGGWQNYPSSMAAATLYKSGTSIRFKEAIRLSDDLADGAGSRLAGYTATWRLFPAVFT